MQNYIPIDIYGKCGPYNCTDSGLNQGFASLAPLYKFYLAFENSNCFEYVTEKYWKTFGHNVVPIVRGAANYTKIAPKNSYIDANALPTAESLGKAGRVSQKNETYLHLPPTIVNFSVN